MRLTAIINLPVVFLALVVGAAAAPPGKNFKLVKGPSRHGCFCLNQHLYCLFTDNSPIGDTDDTIDS